MMARLLAQARKATQPFVLRKMVGGTKKNVIPGSCTADVCSEKLVNYCGLALLRTNAHCIVFARL